MSTPEQQARDMLQRAVMFDPKELTNLIAENAALKAELQALRGSAEPYCYVYEWDTEFGLVQRTSPAAVNGKIFDRVVPLYTRPAVPLTDEHILEYVRDAGLDWHAGWTLDECEPNRYVQFARAIEAHIKEPRHDSSN